jgi:RNA polymerase-binding transcription factor DksA
MTSQGRENLTARRDELLQRLERIRNDLKSGLEADAEEQALQLENRDTLMEIARVTEEELEAVLRQLKNLGEE